MDIKQSPNIIDAENSALRHLHQKLSEYNVKKPLSPEVVERLIVTRFHSCLYRLKHASDNGVFVDMSDEELVKNYCVKERLTLYNFLLRTKGTIAEEAKALVNKEYIYYLRGEERQANIYENEKTVDDVFIFEYK